MVFAHKAIGFDRAGRKERRQSRLVERIDVPPRRIGAPAGLAGAAPDAKVLSIWHADQQRSGSHPLELNAGALKLRDVLEYLGAKDKIKVTGFELQPRGITLDALHPRVIDGRHVEIQRNHSVETLGQQEGEMTVSGTDVQRGSAPRGETGDEISRSRLLGGCLPVLSHVHGQPPGVA